MERYGRAETDIVGILEEERYKLAEIFLVCQNMSCSELIIELYRVIKEEESNGRVRRAYFCSVCLQHETGRIQRNVNKE